MLMEQRPHSIATLDVPYAISPISGCPAIVMPMGTDRNGMPIGLELMARRWNDERLLAIAELVSEMTAVTAGRPATEQ